jgi:sugar lactone lactonase YvrE
LVSGDVLLSPGVYTFTVTAQDSSVPQNTISAAFTLTVIPGIAVCAVGSACAATTNLGSAPVDEVFAAQLAASGGAAPYTFSITSGALPPGLTFSASTGLLEGTPAVPGNYSFQVTATDSNGKTAYATFTMTVPTPVFLVSATGPLVGYPGVPCSFQLTAPGGVPPLSFSLAPASELPPGWTLSSQGVLAGTPATGDGSSSAGPIRVTDSTGNHNDYFITIAVYDVHPAPLPAAALSTSYVVPLATVGFNYTTMSLAGGSLPPGLAFVATPLRNAPTDYTIQGTPTQAGTYTFTISAVGPSGQTASRTYTMTIPAVAGNSGNNLSGLASMGWVGEAYSSLISTGGLLGGPFAFTVTEGALPPGLALQTYTGLLSGTPAAAGTYYFTVSTTGQGQLAVANTAFSVRIYPPLTIGPESIPGAMVNQSYSTTVTVSGGVAPYSIAYGYSSEPGLLWSPNSSSTGTFTLSGTTATPGTYTIFFSVLDATGNYGTRNYSLIVSGAALDIQPTSLPAFQWATPYSQQLSASGGVPPYVFSFSSGYCLPSGISLSSSGLISGTPTATNGSPCLITVHDSANGYGQYSYAISYGSPVMTLSPIALGGGQAGTGYNMSIQAYGTSAVVPIQFTISNGSLPPGLTTATLATSGVFQISGIPLAAGTFPFMLTATDANSHSVSLNYSIVIANDPIVISPPVLPSGMVGAPYSAKLSATGGVAPYTWSVNWESLPVGLTLNSATGVISGIPVPGTGSAFEIEAVDSTGAKGYWTYQVTPAGDALGVTSSLPQGQVNVAYNGWFYASGGTAPYTFSLCAGSLPSGLMLSSWDWGELTGTPQQHGTFSITVEAVDSKGAVGYVTASLGIAGPPETLALSPSTLPTAYAGQAYSTQLVFSGGAAPYQVIGYSGGMWPAGFVIASSGAITATAAYTGTDGAGGPFYLTIQFQDANGSYGSGQISLTVVDNRPPTPTLTISPSSLPACQVGTPYSATVQASGGTPPYVFSGTMPLGLTLSAGGVLSGTLLGSGSPPSGGSGTTGSIKVTATDSAGITGSKTYTVSISQATITLGPANLPNAAAGEPYLAQLTASGGKAPYYFELYPPAEINCGIQLAQNGAIAGTPTFSACGSSLQLSVAAVDANGVAGAGTFQIAIGSPLYIPAQDLPAGSPGAPYSATLAAAGGSPASGSAPYSWSVVSGALPAGLTLAFNKTCGCWLVSGTPTTAGSTTFTVQATDAAGANATAILGITVLNPPSIVSAALPAGAVGTAYSQTVSATGGAPPYTWSLASGTLPVGITLSSAGTLSGTPLEQAVFGFSLQAQDLVTNSASATFSLTIAPLPVSVVTASPLTPAVLGAPYSLGLVAMGGSPPYAWSVASGTLPGGLALAIDGTLSGTPVAEGGYSFTIQAEDSAAQTARATFTFTVTAPAVITTVAGGGVPDTPAAATNALFGEPAAVTADSSGNAYFIALHNVFKVDTSGTLTLVAGSGRPGYTGDGGPAAGAALSAPSGLALDSSGNLYIADTGNNRIRKVSTGGIITTFAGTGVQGYSGDGGQAGSAELNAPTSMALSAAGDLYFFDSGNSLIRKISAAGTIGGTLGIENIRGLAVDASGNLYLTEDGGLVLELPYLATGASNYAGGGINLPGDGGPALSAELEPATGLALNASGDLHVAAGNIRKVSTAGIITTIAGSGAPGYSGDGGPATSAQLNGPTGVAVDGLGNLHIADTRNGRIRKVRPDGTIVTIAGAGDAAYSGDGGAATAARLYRPSNAAADSFGNLYIADTANNRVRKVSPSGVMSTLAGTGVAGDSGDGGQATAAQLNAPAAVAVDATGNVYIADAAAVRNVSTGGVIGTFAGTGVAGYSGDGGAATAAQLNGPSGIAFDSAGDLYIADTQNGRVRKVTPGGSISTVAGTGDLGYSGDGGPATGAQISYPTAVAVDSAGNIYIAAGFVRRVAPNGVIGTLVSDGYITGVAVDAAGNLYLAYPDQHRVSKMYPSGVFASLAGVGTQGYSGDGGPATEAALWSPGSVAVDGAGDVYITDSQANTVRQVTPLNPLSLTAAALPRGATGVSYTQTLAATGGLPPYAWSVAAGALPAGLTLAAGAISGAPTASGIFSFTVQVADSAGLSVSRSFTISVSAGALAVVTTPPLPQGAVGAAYSQTLSDSGGTPPDTNWTVAAGGLPPGLNLSSSGVLSGTPTVNGAYTFTAQVTDSAGATASGSFQLTITLAAYEVGDVSPYTSDWAPKFGDGVLDIQDLIAELFAVNNVAGFRPAACSDRFDAMDLDPADTAAARGGNGVLDIRDLIMELFRVNNLDMSRPMRTSMNGALPWAACTGGSSGSSTDPTAAERRPAGSPEIHSPAEAALIVEQPETFGAGQERIPIYLEAKQALTRVAVTFALGDLTTQLSFTPAAETPPSMVQDSQPGVVSAAWLSGISLPAGQRQLLGYVVAPAGAAAGLSLYGASASGLDDGLAVTLETAGMGSLPQ